MTHTDPQDTVYLSDANALPVYLDYAATTPVDPRVAEAMVPYITEHFGNPASNSHAYGWKAEEAVEHARKQVAKLVNADPREIIWTSGATESDNLAIKGAARFYREIKGNHLITLATEHKAVIDPFKTLEAEGFETKLLAPMSNGLLDLATLEAAIKPETALVSIMLVNNEIGVIQDIAAIGSLCRSHGIVFHVDAAQATGKVAIDLATLPVDLMSFSAHKTSCMCGVNHACDWLQKCMVVVMNVACALELWLRIRLSAWVQHLKSLRQKCRLKMYGLPNCSNAYYRACKRLVAHTSMAT